MSPYCWTSHGCSAQLHLCLCVLLCVSFCMLHVFQIACLCVHLQLPSVLVGQIASHSILRVCVCLPCYVCVSLCLCLFVGMCVHFLPPPPLLKCTWCLCVCPCVFVFMFLCVCVYIFAYMLFPPCGGGAHGRTGQGCGKVWGGDLSH